MCPVKSQLGLKNTAKISIAAAAEPRLRAFAVRVSAPIPIQIVCERVRDYGTGEFYESTSRAKKSSACTQFCRNAAQLFAKNIPSFPESGNHVAGAGSWHSMCVESENVGGIY